MISEIQNQHFVIKKKKQQAAITFKDVQKLTELQSDPNNSNDGYTHV